MGGRLSLNEVARLRGITDIRLYNTGAEVFMDQGKELNEASASGFPK